MFVVVIAPTLRSGGPETGRAGADSAWWLSYECGERIGEGIDMVQANWVPAFSIASPSAPRLIRAFGGHARDVGHRLPARAFMVWTWQPGDR